MVNRYFAAASKEELGQALVERLLTNRRRSKNSAKGRADILSLAYGHYYGSQLGDGSTSEVLRDGQQGELARVRINKARRGAQALLSLLIGPRFTWRPQASNADPGARAATVRARAILEHEMASKRLYGLISRWVEAGIVMSEAYILALWDPSAGPLIGISEDESGVRVSRGGDLHHRLVLPPDVVLEEDAKAFDESPWLFVRTWESRWDLQALYRFDVQGEDISERIANFSGREAMGELSGLSRDASRISGLGEDLVPVWRFFHRASPALPFGREVLLLSGDLVLRDLPLETTYPFGPPLYRFAPEEQLDTPHGYTAFWDTLGAQQLKDGIESSCATNLLTLGTQAVAVEEGSKVQVDSATGMRLLYFRAGGSPPQFLQGAKLPPEAMAYLEKTDRDQLDMLGLNDTFLGQPQSAQMNAQAFALLASLAVQANGHRQSNFFDALARYGTGVIRTLSRNVTEEREVPVVGKHNRALYAAQRYKGKDLDCITQVVVDVGNAIEQTAPGRAQLLEWYLQLGLVKTPEEVSQVLETGRLEPAMQPARDASLLIAEENESILRGETPPVHPFHDALHHCPLHGALASNPELLASPQAQKALREHVDEHYRSLFGLPAPVDPMTGAPLVDPMTGQPIKADPLMDPQWPVRIRMLLGQQPPPMGLAPVENMPVEGPSPGAAEAPEGLPQLQSPGTGAPSGAKNPLTGQPLGPTPPLA